MLKDSCDEAQKPFPTHGPSHLPTKKKQASIHNQHLNYLYIASQQLFGYLHTEWYTVLTSPQKKWNAKQFKIPKICVTSNSCENVLILCNIYLP